MIQELTPKLTPDAAKRLATLNLLLPLASPRRSKLPPRQEPKPEAKSEWPVVGDEVEAHKDYSGLQVGKNLIFAGNLSIMYNLTEPVLTGWFIEEKTGCGHYLTKEGFKRIK